MHYSIHIQKKDLKEFGEYFSVKYLPDFNLRDDKIINEKYYADIQEMIFSVESHIVLMHVWGNDVVCKINRKGLSDDETSKISNGLLRICEELVI